MNTGVQNSQDFGLPFIRIRNDPNLGSSIASLGATLSVPRARVDTNWHFIDSLSWKLDRHEIKFGYEFRRTFVNARSAADAQRAAIRVATRFKTHTRVISRTASAGAAI